MRSNLVKPTLQCCRVSQRVPLPVGTNKGFLREFFGLVSIPDQISDVPDDSTAILLDFIRSSRRGRFHVRSILLESCATRSKSPLDAPGIDPTIGRENPLPQ